MNNPGNSFANLRVLVVDDHPVMRSGTRQLVQRECPGAEVAEVGTAGEALNAVVGGRWNLVVLDLDLPDRSGLDLLTDFKLAAPNVPVLVYSGLPELEFGLQTVRAGAAGYVSKSSPPAEFADALKRVLAGGVYVSAALGECLARSLQPGSSIQPHESLSAREFQLLVLIGGGRTVGEIAGQLSLSVKTVSTYRARLLKKMSMATNAELTHYALAHHLTR
jgi:DNA-binding NarL/FixJ family response regulator